MFAVNFYQDDTVDSLFTELAYEDDLFLLDDGYAGFSLIMSPGMFNMGKSTHDQICSMLRDVYVDDGFLNIMSFSCPDLRAYTNGIKANVKGESVAARALIKFYVEWLSRYNDVRNENYQLPFHNRVIVVSYKAPLEKGFRLEKGFSARYLDRMGRAKNAVKARLGQCGFYPSELDATGYTWLMNTIFNWHPDARWKDREAGELYDEDKLLREQFFDRGTVLNRERNGLLSIQHGDRKTWVSVLTTDRYPKRPDQHFSEMIAGDVRSGGHNTVNRPNLVSTTIYMRPTAKAAMDFAWRLKIWRGNKVSKVLSEKPEVAEVIQSFEQARLLVNEESSKLVKVHTTVVQFASSEEDAHNAEEQARSYYSNRGFHAQRDPEFAAAFFVAAMPFGGSLPLVETSSAYQSCPIENIPPLAPIAGDFTGLGSGDLLFPGRTGQLARAAIYTGDTDPNAIIAAQSGKGKSFLGNFIITSALASGQIVRAVEEGESYKKLADVVGGEYMDFGAALDEGESISFNPFTRLSLDPKDREDEVELITSIMASMATINEKLSDIQYAELQNIVSEVIEKHGRDSSVDLIMELCNQHDDPRMNDVGVQLKQFSSRGIYGKYFAGPANIEWSSQMVGLELGRLKTKERLRPIIMMLLMVNIAQELADDSYLDTTKLVIMDETWALLDDPYVSKFIEKLYRQIRKHNGAVLCLTQSTNDILSKSCGHAIMANTGKIILLQHNNTDLAMLKKNQVLGDPETNGWLYSWFESVRTKDRYYSEFLFYSKESGLGIMRFSAPKIMAQVFSSNAKERQAVARLKEKGMTTMDAVHHFLQESATPGIQEELEIFSRILAEEKRLFGIAA